MNHIPTVIAAALDFSGMPLEKLTQRFSHGSVSDLRAALVYILNVDYTTKFQDLEPYFGVKKSTLNSWKARAMQELELEGSGMTELIMDLRDHITAQMEQEVPVALPDFINLMKALDPRAATKRMPELYATFIEDQAAFFASYPEAQQSVKLHIQSPKA